MILLPCTCIHERMCAHTHVASTAPWLKERLQKQAAATHIAQLLGFLVSI